MSAQSLLKVENLKTHFRLSKPHPFATPQTVFAVDGVSFEIERGKTFGLVGESGCGKSTTALSVLRLVEPTSGSVIVKETDVCQLNRKELRRFRRNMQVIFQDPYSSMNPRTTAGELIRSPLKILKIGTTEEQNQRVEELLRLVGLRPEQRNLFPHQFSGGQRQRICVARALASNPDFIVCDEPVSALDVAIQAQILNLLIRLQRELDLTYLFISHDMAVIQHMCDEIAVMYLGKIVEQADRRSLFKQPLHPYTKALLSAVPTVPSGCLFHTRCSFIKTECLKVKPTLLEILPGHRIACHRVKEGGFN
jgi:peptide/nickel transport system ATP-binding protein